MHGSAFVVGARKNSAEASALAALRKGQISIDLLDVVATFAALATRRPITASFVIWMVGVGDLLLDISANNARSALSMLMRRRDQEALRVLPDGALETVPIGDLQVGDHHLCQPLTLCRDRFVHPPPEASIADLTKRGGTIALSTCGPKKRLCVLLEETEGQYGDRKLGETYMIPKGY